MSIFKEFKEFAIKGNVMDLAVAVVIGAAFGKIISSLVSDIIMPVISLITGRMDFANLFVSLDGNVYETLQLAKDAGASTLNYGLFIMSIVDFIFIAFAVFIVIRSINRTKSVPAAKAPDTKTCPFCQSSVSIQAVKCPFCTSDLK